MNGIQSYDDELTDEQLEAVIELYDDFLEDSEYGTSDYEFFCNELKDAKKELFSRKGIKYPDRW